MKHFSPIIFFIGFSALLHGQDLSKYDACEVTYCSSRNVYVKFASTENVNVGDTIYIKSGSEMAPHLMVSNKSSTSCVCAPLATPHGLKKTDKLYLPKKAIEKTEPPPIEDDLEKGIETASDTAPEPKPETNAFQPEKVEKEAAFKQKIKGRFSTASYSNISGLNERHRMRYAFTFRGNNLKNSRFSTDNYITFRHTLGEWEQVQNNFSDAFKIYALSAKYEFNKEFSATVGRKINPRISGMGAIDGLQLEKGLGAQFRMGAILGSRPNLRDYSIDFNLMQAGTYLSYVSGEKQKYQRSTFGFIEQRNGGKVDRRFIYFQYSGSLVKNLNLFTSFETDLFENINGEAKNKPSLTNLYTALRYRFNRKIRLSVSYDNRRNIIYYESYKNFIERLIENETRQGLRVGFNLRPAKMLTWGVNSSMRFVNGEGMVTRNLNSYWSYSRIPKINTMATFAVNLLETGFIKSQIYTLRLSKDIFKKKINTSLYLKKIAYDHKNSENQTLQHVAGLNLAIRLYKKLSLYLYCEGTYNKERPTLYRANTRLIQRF